MLVVAVVVETTILLVLWQHSPYYLLLVNMLLVIKVVMVVANMIPFGMLIDNTEEAVVALDLEGVVEVQQLLWVLLEVLKMTPHPLVEVVVVVLSELVPSQMV